MSDTEAHERTSFSHLPAYLQGGLNILEKNISAITSQNQEQQICTAFKLASETIFMSPADKRLYTYPSFSAQRIDGTLYLAFNNLVAPNSNVMVMDESSNKLRPLNEVAKTLNQKAEQALRNMVREGVYVAYGAKAPSPKKN